MTGKVNTVPASSLWVGLWNKRHVVFDPAIQPADSKFVLLYFVEGKSLCTRERETERRKVKTVRNPGDIAFALSQYRKWLSSNAPIVEEKKSRPNMTVENPPPPRRKCSQCDSQGTWHYTIGTFSDGAHSDGQNIIEHCSLCGGHGFVDDVFEF